MQFSDTGLTGAVGTTEHALAILNAVADDAAATMIAGWSKHVDRTLEGVERVLLPILGDGKRAVVVVSTDIAASHDEINLP